MLRVLTKALNRHLEKFPERGICTLKDWGNEGDKEKLLHALTPQLEKHLLLKDELFLEFSDSLNQELNNKETKNVSKNSENDFKPKEKYHKENKKNNEKCKMEMENSKNLKEVIKGLNTSRKDVKVADGVNIPREQRSISESLLKRAELLERRRKEANALLEIIARREKLRKSHKGQSKFGISSSLKQKSQTSSLKPSKETKKNEMVVKITKDSLELCPKDIQKVSLPEKDHVKIQNAVKIKSANLTDKIYDLGSRIDKEIKAMLALWVEKNDSEMKLLEIEEVENEIHRNSTETLNKYMNKRKSNLDRKKRCLKNIEMRPISPSNHIHRSRKSDNIKGKAAQEKCAANALAKNRMKDNLKNSKICSSKYKSMTSSNTSSKNKGTFSTYTEK